MFYFAYLAILIMGLTLGLIGAGGAILSIPILNYLFGISTEGAIVYSYFIIGMISAFGSIPGIRSNKISYKAVIWFGIPSIISIFIIRKLIVKWIPDSIIQFDHYNISKDNVTMLLFSMLMIWSAIKMLKPDLQSTKKEIEFQSFQVILVGLFVGCLTGLLGVGGGFIIIPTFILFFKMEMNIAIYTSLTIISLNTLVGFILSYNGVTNLNWVQLLSLTFIALLGMLVGIKLRSKLNNLQLKTYFAYLILVMSGIILFVEFNKIL